MFRTLFTSLMGLIDAPLLTVLDQGIANSIAYVSGWLVYAIAMLIVFFGLAVAVGLTQTPARNSLVVFGKIALVVAFTSQTTYTYYVRDLINVALPHDLGSLLGSAPSSTAHSFDVLWNQSQDGIWSVYGHMSALDVRRYLLVLVLLPLTVVAVCFGFGVFLMGHVMGVVYCTIGPVMISLMLFNSTRPIFTAWCGCTLSTVVLQALAIILATTLVRFETMIAGQIVTDASGDVQAQTGMLVGAAVVFLLCAWFALQLPNAAAALCGGIHFSPHALAAETYGRFKGAFAFGAVKGLEFAQSRMDKLRDGLRTAGTSAAASGRSFSPPGPSLSRATP